MASTVNAAGLRKVKGRKVRCPKCSALLTEPQTPIYECPICSSLLVGSKPSGNRVLKSSGDADDIQQILEGEVESSNVSESVTNGTYIEAGSYGEAHHKKRSLDIMAEWEPIDLSLLQGTSIHGPASSLLKQYHLLHHYAHNGSSALSNRFLLHPTNCLCLATSYSQCLDLVFYHIKTSVDGSCLNAGSSSASLDKLNLPLSALHCSIQEGIRFLGDCKGPDPMSQHQLLCQWLIDKAVFLAFSTDIFHRHLHDLVWCMSVLMRIFDSLHADDHVSDEAGLREMLMKTWIHGKEEEDVKSFQMFLAKLTRSAPQYQEGQNISELAKIISHRLSCRAEGRCEPVDGCVLQENLMVDSEGFAREESIGNGSFAKAFVVAWRGGTFASKEFFHVADEATFLREAGIQARLWHPNVVPLVCCTKSTSTSNKCSLVMELMHEDLRNLIIRRLTSRMQDGSESQYQDEPFSLLVAVDLMLQIAMGMEYLHSLHIAHRDHKSDNILVSHPSPASNLCSELDHVRVKIADFGMSKTKQTSKSSFSTRNVGATAWRAPETFDIDSDDEGSEVVKKYTLKADVYSFAMVCYEILTGKLPSDYFGKLRGLRNRLIKGDRPNLPQSCPLALSIYIQRCWHGIATERPAFKEICTVLRYFKLRIACGDLQSLAWPLDDDDLLNANQVEKNSYQHVQILDMMFQMWTLAKRSNYHHNELMATLPDLHEPMATLPDPHNPNEAYIFASKYFIKIKINDDGSDELILSPRIIEEYWPPLRTAKFSTVDAMFPCPQRVGRTYIFCKDQCVSIMLEPNTLNSRLLQGPIPIYRYWPSLESVSFNRLDAAFVRPGTKDEVYCFKGEKCVLMKVIPFQTTHYIIRGPSEITKEWPALKEAGFYTVDAVLPSPKGNGQAYFFSKSHYVLIEAKARSSLARRLFKSHPLYVDCIVQKPLQVGQGWHSLRALVSHRGKR